MSSTFKNWTSDNYAFVGKAFDFAYADRLNKLSPVVGEVNAKSIDYELRPAPAATAKRPATTARISTRAVSSAASRP